MSEKAPHEKLKLYEEQLQAVEAAIAQDPTNDEWLKLKTDLLEVIRLTQQLSEVKGEVAGTSTSAAEGASAAAAASDVQSYSVGDRCQALFEMDGQWYNAKIVALVEDGFFVSFLGYGNTAQVDFSEVRQYVRPDTSEWRPGTEVTAIAVADSRWYPAKIVSVGKEVAKLRFTGESEVVEVELDSIRLPAAATAVSTTTAPEAKPETTTGSKLPKGMEIRPDDSEEEIARKKRKLKMFKRSEKRAKEESAVDDRRSSWQSFAGKNKTIKKVKNGHDPNWDPTRDHSELAARVAMDKFNNFAARESR
mmetsp:Transcript_38378/g.76898  ORF Transcript_38378/g.76898 Transcript_38378/m.76898 type:complete len:306 (-) Transcript_38378:382-1299(-)